MNREDFPMIKQNYIYFNNAATTYKPQVVIDQLIDYYQNYSFNTNRGVAKTSYDVTEKYENTRKYIADFLNVALNEIIFTRGTTEAINLVAHFFKKLPANSEVLVSNEEHHAVFVTMQQLCLENNLIFKVVDFEKVAENINQKTKVVAVSHLTNVLGKRSGLEKISNLKEKYDFYFLVDGAQGIVHEKLDLEKLKIDFYAFSGHKIYGPFGVGVLYAKFASEMKPIYFGGEMVDQVELEKTTFKETPYRFEAGTMMIPEVIALQKAMYYVTEIGYQKINNHLQELKNYLINEMQTIPNIIIYNQNPVGHCITFNVRGVHAHDVATYLDKQGIIVRAGHHCTEPLMKKLGVSATVRLSLGLYNNQAECQKLIDLLKKGDYLNDIF